MSDVQNIFKLRKEGRLDEALALAEALYARIPADPWVIRAYGWVLYDRLKAALASESEDEIFLCSGKLENLDIPEEDEILSRQVGYLLSQASQSARKFKRACSIDYNGNHEEALALFREMKKDFSGDLTTYHRAYGWCLYKYLKNLITNQAAGREVYKSLLDEYFTLQPEKPSVLHSSLLFLLLSHFKDDSDFLRKWEKQMEWSLFREEDFDSYAAESGKVFPGLAERSVQALAKAILSGGGNDEMDGFQRTLDNALNKFPSNIWLYYYKAKMLVRLGREEEARNFVIPVIRQKKGDYWSWALLGDMVDQTDPELAVSCFCNALMCSSEEKFLMNTRWSFGRLLRQQGYDAEARCEFESSIKARRDAGYDLSTSQMLISEEAWFKSAPQKDNNKPFYKEHAGKALEFVFGSLPRFKGCFVRTFIRPDDPRKSLRARILFSGTEGSLVAGSVRVQNYPSLKDAQPGQGILVTANPSDGMKIMEVALRETAEAYDILPWQTGIADHVNKAKNITHIAWSRTEGGLLQGQPYKEGDFVRVKVMTKKEDNRNFPNEILIHEHTEELPSTDLAQPFKGKLKLNMKKGFGFVGSVFVSPGMVTSCGLKGKDGSTVGGLAVPSFNTKTGQWGWKAVDIS